MGQLDGKKIILSISGSIAAYKSALLTRLLIKAGAKVKVLMTPMATHFISPLTLSTLSGNEVLVEVSSEAGWNNHVELGLWADAFVVAPTTATTLGRLAGGLADTIIGAVYLSARCPVFFAPAMDLDMWQHPATQHNVQRLQHYGNHLIPVGEGFLASGLQGVGRMAEPETIVAYLADFFAERQLLRHKRFLITAGPTHEPLDPVRFIGNRSSGKMGIALAKAAARRGATVDLVLGPTSYGLEHPNVHVHRVTTAQEMYEACLQHYPACDVAIMAAAVGDYRVEEVAEQKIKKQAGQQGLHLHLVENPDIAATLGARKTPKQLLVGFALETENGLQHAREKMQRKHLDMIVLNSLQDEGAGFHGDTNRISILGVDNKAQHFELKSKDAVAIDILNVIQDYLDTALENDNK